jgi:hypothetical protein
MMMMSSRGRYTAFSLAALLSALFFVAFQQQSQCSFVAATARRPAASLSNPAIATDGGPRDFTAKARKAWVAESTKKSVEEVAQLGAGGNYFVHSSCIMQAPGIGSDATMSLVDNDVASTVLHEFVYHGIKNLGFDESNVHVHVSNGGGHSDIVVIEWEIELNNQMYKAQDTKGYFNHLFKNENWHNHVTSWMKGQGKGGVLKAAEAMKNLEEFALILPAHIDTKAQTNFDDASHTEEVKSLIDKWLGSKKPDTDTITLYAGCSPTSTLTFTPTDFSAQVGASIITKSLNNDFLFDHAVEMEQTDCGTFKTKVLPKKGEEFGFYLFWKDNLTEWESVSDIGCTGPNTDKCPPGDVLASLASCTNAVQNPGFVSHNRVFDGTTLTYNWGTCENSCGTKPASCGGTPQLGKTPVPFKKNPHFSHSPLGLAKPKRTTTKSFASSSVAFIGAAVVAVVAVVAYKATSVERRASNVKPAAVANIEYGAAC